MQGLLLSPSQYQAIKNQMEIKQNNNKVPDNITIKIRQNWQIYRQLKSDRLSNSFPGFSPTRPTELRRAVRREPWERGWQIIRSKLKLFCF